MKRSHAVTVVLVMLCLFTGAQMAIGASYAIVDLGSADGIYSEARAINNSNQVLYNAAGSVMLWQNEQFTNLGKFGGNGASGIDINDNGMLTGIRLFGGYSRAFSYLGGTIANMGSFNGNGTSDAFALNDAGQVVGSSYSSTANEEHAFLYDPTTGLKDIHLLGISSGASGINDAGWVVGHYYTDLVGRGIHVFLYHDNVMTTINGMHAVYDINNLNMISGTLMPNSTDFHAAFWQNNVVTDMGTLGGCNSAANGSNDIGWIVGSSNTSSEAGHGFLWKDGMMLDINGLIDPTSGWTVTNGWDVNDNGWIVGQGNINGTYHAIVLMPVPEPSSIFALLTGTMGLCVLGRRPRCARVS